MRDLIYLAITVGFFAVAAVYVRACEHIIGPDETPPDATDPAVHLDGTHSTAGSVR